MHAAPPIYKHDPVLETFLNALAARRFFLTISETRLARAMLSAGFSSEETEAFFRASKWAAYYRDCVGACHLPESQTILEALRRAFDSGATIEEAGAMALEPLRSRAQLPGVAEGKSLAEIDEWWSESFRFDNETGQMV